MPSSAEFAKILRTSWLGEQTAPQEDDYWLIVPVGSGYAARNKHGLPAVVIPVASMSPQMAGRRAAGCELAPIRRAKFRYQDKQWEGAAAALVCIDNDVVDSFMVLAADVMSRIGDQPTWEGIISIVQQWQSLLSAKGRLNPEGETGLWGELWFLASAANVSLMLASWRGPEGDSTDFFLDGKSAEVKTSRHRRQHHVSMSQVQEPTGTHPAWLVSLWVKEDPVRGLTVPQLVAKLEAAYEDHGDLHRRLLRAGYTHSQRNAYVTKLVTMDKPEWYAVADVPAIRAADPGVSDVRYRVVLDKDKAADNETAAGLWKHFLGQDYPAKEQ